MLTQRSAAILVIVCACGNNSTPSDATVPDIDNGACGSMVRFTGEYVDWDSGVVFCGILGATFEVEGGGAKQITPPNGRIDLCVPDEPMVLVDVTPPVEASQCAAPPGTVPPPLIYTLPAIAVANKAVIAAGGAWSGRGFVMGRQAVDPTKAQIFVHVNGTPRPVSISAHFSSSQARTNDMWSAGSTGDDVFFLDVDPTGGSTTLTAESSIGTGSIPLVAGKMTIVSIITR